jgi:hypothetical protein
MVGDVAHDFYYSAPFALAVKEGRGVNLVGAGWNLRVEVCVYDLGVPIGRSFGFKWTLNSLATGLFLLEHQPVAGVTNGRRGFIEIRMALAHQVGGSVHPEYPFVHAYGHDGISR